MSATSSYWDERLGHVVMFEALPGTTDAVRRLMSEACDWLRSHGLEAARTGMGPGFDLPFIIDEYDLLPPISTRQNPPYYHSLLKEARFETEKGWVDYKIEVTPQLVERWERMVSGAQQSGFRVLSMGEVPSERRVADFTMIWEDAFKSHWGFTPSSEAEWAELFDFVGPLGAYDISVIAYRAEQPVGVVMGLPDLSMMATLDEGRELSGAERLNMLGIGVHESARGRGVNLAMAAKSYLALVKVGATHVSYTMVLDDNWPSRLVRVGTPPKNSNAATWAAWNVSEHSRGYAERCHASECGNVITANAAFIRSPAITTAASPKSNWASPGGCDSGTNTSRPCHFVWAT